MPSAGLPVPSAVFPSGSAVQHALRTQDAHHGAVDAGLRECSGRHGALHGVENGGNAGSEAYGATVAGPITKDMMEAVVDK